MKKYCYVMVLSNGDECWSRILGRSDQETLERNWEENNLEQMLLSGWRPVRETALPGESYAYGLVLLERD